MNGNSLWIIYFVKTFEATSTTFFTEFTCFFHRLILRFLWQSLSFLTSFPPLLTVDVDPSKLLQTRFFYILIDLPSKALLVLGSFKSFETYSLPDYSMISLSVYKDITTCCRNWSSDSRRRRMSYNNHTLTLHTLHFIAKLR